MKGQLAATAPLLRIPSLQVPSLQGACDIDETNGVNDIIEAWQPQYLGELMRLTEAVREFRKECPGGGIDEFLDWAVTH